MESPELPNTQAIGVPRDRSTDEEMIGDAERAEAMDPDVGAGTPESAPEVLPPESRTERITGLVRRIVRGEGR
jgi:hypothetical protein